MSSAPESIPAIWLKIVSVKCEINVAYRPKRPATMITSNDPDTSRMASVYHVLILRTIPSLRCQDIGNGLIIRPPLAAYHSSEKMI